MLDPEVPNVCLLLLLLLLREERSRDLAEEKVSNLQKQWREKAAQAGMHATMMALLSSTMLGQAQYSS